MIDEHPILLEDVESVYYFYGPRKVKAPREACEELIKLMNKVMSKYRLEMPVHIHTYHFQACENLRRQLNLKKD